MNSQGAFTAALLDSSSKAYAAGAILRMQETGDESAGLVEELGFKGLVEDTQQRLQSLAEALAVGRPELFVRDIEWLAATHSARQVTPQLLRTILACLQQELAENLPEDAAADTTSYLQAAIDALVSEATPPQSQLGEPAPHGELANQFLLAVLEGQRAKAEEVIFEALDEGVSVAELHSHVITKAQVELGRMWQVGEVYVAEEHFGSRIVEDVLAQLRGRMAKKPANRKCVLAASVSGNLHDIGLRMVSDHFEMSGWRTIYLGANMPVDDLVRAARDFKPDLVALSAGLGTNVRAAAKAIERLRAELPGTPILIGGKPFAAVPDLWKDVGADGCASDAASAVRLGTQLAER